ncbi:MAG: ABC transporter ATP-binding protein [Ruminococcaceae bacterium]|nr:ABC transporter ATP-binding protein [Oscillospiraceae bacterium]
MLPLDKLPEGLYDAAKEQGIDADGIEMCLGLDLNMNAAFGECWLIVTRENFFRFEIPDNMACAGEIKSSRDKNPERFKSAVTVCHKICDLEELAIDNFVSSNRLVAKKDGETIILAYATNAKKQKLFAMMEIIDRWKKGENVPEDDPIFEQFNKFCPKCGRPYNDPKRKVCLNCLNEGAIYGRLFRYFAPYKKQLAVIIACLLLQSVITLVNPYFGGVFLYNEVLDPSGRFAGNIALGVGAVFFTALATQVTAILRARANSEMSVSVTLDMKMDIFTAMQRLSLSYFNNNQTGRLITRVDYDAARIRAFFTDNMPSLIVNVITFVTAAVVMFTVKWQLALIVFVPVPIIAVFVKKAFPKLWKSFTMRWRKSSALNAMLGDSLTGIRVVKAFAKEDVETHRFSKYVDAYAKANLRVNALHLMIFPTIGLLMSISVQTIWGFGGFMVMGDTMTYGEFLTFIAYTSMILNPIIFFTNISESFTDMANSAQRMFEVLDAVPEITESENPVSLPDMKGEIELKNVSFSYTPNRPILKNMSMKIEAGTSIGLVGHTGAGKSTIANLITRLYDVNSGNIYIDGVNIKDIELQTLRKKMAIVSQEIFLFRGTIADNIRYARPDATMEEVIEASKAANAHDFIINLPSGYETVVGVGSRSLSGGEQQRISIARALLLDPCVLILDEATAAMDTETERLIQQALARLVKGRTTITIAHRLSTLKDCSILYAIENGEIAESGSHAELIAKKGIYYKLYTLQSEAMKKVIGN